MKVGKWLALIRRDRFIPLRQLAERAPHHPSDDVVVEDDETLVYTAHDRYTGNDAEVVVSFDVGPGVREEAEKIARWYGNERRDLEQILASDACYELIWDLRYNYETYNTLFLLATSLQELCGAIVFDVTHQRFVLDELP